MNLRYDFIYLQEQDYIPILKMHYELFTKSFYGKAVELAIVFNPVDMPSEKETAEVAKIWSDVDSNYISAGVMSAEEVRDVRRSQDDSPYSALADEMEGAPDEELNQAADEALDGGVGSGNFNHSGRLGLRGGSASSGGAAYFSSIESQERILRNLPDEKGVILEKNGNFFRYIKGKGLNITCKPSDLQEMKDRIFIHNHPNNVTFSEKDLETAFKVAKVAELRVVTPSGMNYSIKPLTNSDIDGLLNAYRKEERIARSTALIHITVD